MRRSFTKGYRDWGADGEARKRLPYVLKILISMYSEDLKIVLNTTSNCLATDRGLRK